MEQARLETISEQELTGIALSAIIAKAATLSRDPELNAWKVYEAAKQAIAEFNLTQGEYERAIKLLTEALGI